jgi:signal transduction histidine kinase
VPDWFAQAVHRQGDIALGAGIATLAVVQLAGYDEPVWAKLVAAASVIVLGVAAALRTRYPILLLALLVVSMPVGALLPKHFGDVEAVGLFVVVAVYSAAAHTGGLRVVVAGVLSGAVAIGALVGDPEELNVAAVVFISLVVGGPWVAGRIVRRRRLGEARLEREKASAEAAIVEERARIARELHDAVAHAISVIVLQARGGRRLLDQEPEEARRALDAIDRTASQALAEMRRLLGLLRENDEQIALAPQPTLARLDDLVAQVRGAGLPVEVYIEGAPAELPPGVDLSAYRIVQEALTNALKHAGPATARVTLRYRDCAIDVEICDDGTGGGNEDGTGQGLAGIQERVAIFGGEVNSGPRADGGYVVRARLPYVSQR